jgi:hypothetical protein
LLKEQVTERWSYQDREDSLDKGQIPEYAEHLLKGQVAEKCSYPDPDDLLDKGQIPVSEYAG